MPTTKLSVQGMSCANCVAHVTRALQATPGVEHAQVDLASQSASVTGSASLEALIAAVEEEGYTAAEAGA
jgi:copper chaperone CopZ